MYFLSFSNNKFYEVVTKDKDFFGGVNLVEMSKFLFDVFFFFKVVGVGPCMYYVLFIPTERLILSD